MSSSATTPAAGAARLHVVTGKGGTGKTTVAAALALRLASLHRRVLLVEVEGRQGISQVLDVPPLSTSEELLVRVAGGGEIWGLSVDAKAALLEYLQLFYHLGRAGNALEKVGAIDFATTIAPGVRDVLTIGKVYDAARSRVDGTRSGTAPYAYDHVVLDAPPTGRVVRFLNVNSEVADLAKVGPIRHQADSITRLLRSDATAVHLVTLLEEMPVQETLDAVPELRAAHLPVGSILVNQARDAYLSPAGVSALEEPGGAEAVRARLADGGLPSDDAVVAGLLAEARAYADRLALEDRQLATLEGAGLPMVVLPYVVDPVGASGLRELAQEIVDQGVWS